MIDFAQFRPDLTGATLSDGAWQEALTFLRDHRTDVRPGWGQGTLRLPAGHVRLSQGFLMGSSAIGFAIEGAGKHATTIEFENETDPFLDMGTNIAVALRRLSVVQRGARTNSLIRRTGAGGGKELHLDEIHTEGFGVIDENTGTVNGDTTRMTFSRFVDAGRIIKGSSSQAVVNVIDQCSIYGETEHVLDVAGYGQTHIIGGNIVIDGSILHLRNQADRYGGTAHYSIRGTAVERLNKAGHAGGSRTRLVTCEPGQHIDASVALDQVNLISGPDPDPDHADAIQAQQGLRVHVRGGGIDPAHKIRTYGGAMLPGKASGIRLDGLTRAPGPQQIVRDDWSTQAKAHAPITWRDCTGVPNCTANAGWPSHAGPGEASNWCASGRVGYLVAGPEPQTFTLDLTGAPQRFTRAEVVTGRKMGSGPVTVEAYADAALTQHIGTAILEGPSGQPARATVPLYDHHGEAVHFTASGATAMLGGIRVYHEALSQEVT